MSVGSGLNRLDHPDALDHLDSLGVLGVVERFAEQVGVGWEAGRATTGLPEGTGIESILILGMGGSGISGDVTRAILEGRVAVPVHVLKNYAPIPAWAGRNTLVFAVSYSGGTEETIAAVQDVAARGGRVVAVTSGGRLGELSDELGFARVGIPAGLQPRASLGYLVIPILAVLEQIGLVPALDADVREAVGVIEGLAGRCERSVPLADNPAKQLAAALEGRIPVVYGGQALTSVAAYRFKCDLNEYAKTPAFSNELPEMNHNEIEGWSGLGDMASDRFVAVYLRDEGEHPRVAKRFEVTKGLVRGNIERAEELWSQGTSSLARLLSLIFVTQMAAIYLGLAYGVDPGPVAVIEELKVELAKED